MMYNQDKRLQHPYEWLVVGRNATKSVVTCSNAMFVWCHNKTHPPDLTLLSYTLVVTKEPLNHFLFRVFISLQCLNFLTLKRVLRRIKLDMDFRIYWIYILNLYIFHTYMECSKHSLFCVIIVIAILKHEGTIICVFKLLSELEHCGRISISHHHCYHIDVVMYSFRITSGKEFVLIFFNQVCKLG